MYISGSTDHIVMSYSNDDEELIQESTLGNFEKFLEALRIVHEYKFGERK